MPEIDTKNLQKELKEIIARIVEVEPDKITQSAKFVEDLGMDSMMALEILSAIEKKYKIQVPEEKLNKLRTLEETVKLTIEYLNG